eukprot:CAMPEP_0118674034 /NCGR_PEP_ID=MMETSP0800-20121206/664_1 /TAXON_ID=210618 ORGANISM="Striatella unipunctata, Strain CCMP2910" /NCGR_SAMPLE_ID=MMETSP0800 /ASSEMBLY_ACC=CAM_ASM_000638 /LENGTH=199 /DNA_ID=CAMNT_0006569185 /DNA_START=141 /DNA_END=740 /DNA_ORIENTATION=-
MYSTLKFFLLVILVVATVPSSNAFGNFLACYVELDPEEVIMRQQVKAASESSEPGILFRVYNANGESVPLEYTRDEGEPKAIVSVPMNESRFTLKLEVPPDKKHLRDLQYVVDATEGGRFVPPSAVLCKGARAFVRGMSQGNEVALELLHQNDENLPSSVKVWAGWATGYSEVSLTPTVEFRVAQAPATETTEASKEEL